MDPILDIIKKYDPEAQKIVQPIIYRWFATTQKENYSLGQSPGVYVPSGNYKLYCEYMKVEADELGLLNITVLNMVNGAVLSKKCQPSEIDNYVNYVINYVNQYP